MVVWLHYLPHWALTNDKNLKLGCSAPPPPSARRRQPDERDHRDVRAGAGGGRHLLEPCGGDGTGAGLGPFLVGSLVWGIGLSLGGTTGYAINPARDLGPRLAHAVLPIAGKRDSDWGYAAIPVVGPLVGGALAGLVVAVVGF